MAINNRMFVVAMSGPPRSGKDSIANRLALQLGATNALSFFSRVQLSLPMRKSIMGMLGLTYEEGLYERIKDEVQPATGITLRQMMINLSESHAKKLYGKDFWVRCAMHALPVSNRVVIISDLGFIEELDFLNEYCGRYHVLTVGVTRDGTTWEGDSRTPLASASTHLEVANNGSINEAAVAIRKHCKEMGWPLFSTIG